MKKICNAIIVILVIIIIALLTRIIILRNQSAKNEAKIKETISQVQEKISIVEDKKIPYIEYEGYQVIGIIKIDKINLEYPILNSKDDEAMKKSIIKFSGDEINGVGNITLSGHNYKDGTMFANIDKLKLQDKISIIDMHNNQIEYKIFNIFVTDPNDIEVVNSIEKDTREITLITCSKGSKSRLIIKAREIL